MLWHVTVCHNVLQSVIVCHSVSHSVRVFHSVKQLHSITVCHSVLMFACHAKVLHRCATHFLKQGYCPGNTIPFSFEASENGSIWELTLKPQSGNGDSCTCSPTCLCPMCLCRAHQCLPATGATSCVWGVPRLYFYYPLVSGAILFQNGISVPEKVQPGPDCLMGPRYAEFVQFMLHNVLFI